MLIALFLQTIIKETNKSSGQVEGETTQETKVHNWYFISLAFETIRRPQVLILFIYKVFDIFKSFYISCALNFHPLFILPMQESDFVDSQGGKEQVCYFFMKNLIPLISWIKIISILYCKAGIKKIRRKLILDRLLNNS